MLQRTKVAELIMKQKIHDSILDLVGNTPIVRLQRIGQDTGCELLVKIESFNPMASVKDRIAKSMIEAAEENKLVRKGTTIVEPTSGNTGIGLAMVAAAKGFRLILVMPDNMSHERRRILTALGAEQVLTPGSDGMAGAINKAKESGAGAVVLGCMSMAFRTAKTNWDVGIPVINPLSAAIKVAESFVDMGISQSRVTYPAADFKKLVGTVFKE